ncbi:MAG: peptidoglycan-associated lipoprotein Pal [Acidobacteria bacterium]|nr:peptidoglycan-associated lipoprotein Pal [Acidobacteriota bacterium]
MNTRRTQALALAAIVVVLVAGCGKKQPDIPEPMAPAPEPVTPTVDVEPLPEPSVVEDATPDWESGDLAELNRIAMEEGHLGDVYFDYDKSDLGSEATDRLAANAAFLREHGNLVITVEGHCDERGTNAYNLALGDRRANAATGYVTSLGIDGSRMGSVSYGEERPQCSTAAESCWSRNRRAHFVITGN